MMQGDEFKGELSDVELDAVLGDFKASAHAWSEAAYNRPRKIVVARQRSWKLATGWALGCVLIAGTLTGGVHQRQVRQERANAVAAEQVRQQQEIARSAQMKVRAEDSDLMASVETDVSRAVPSAMEPLAQLMDEGESQ